MDNSFIQLHNQQVILKEDTPFKVNHIIVVINNPFVIEGDNPTLISTQFNPAFVVRVDSHLTFMVIVVDNLLTFMVIVVDILLVDIIIKEHHTMEVVVEGNHHTFEVDLKFIEEDNLDQVAELDIPKLGGVVNNLALVAVAYRSLVLTFAEQDIITAAIDKLVVRSQLVKVYRLNKLRLEQNFHEPVS